MDEWIDPHKPFKMLSSHQYTFSVSQFWKEKVEEVSNKNVIEKKKNGTMMPASRIKKAIGINSDLLVSSEAVVISTKACELFIQELVYRSWLVAQEGKRRTLHRTDISASLMRSDHYDFLVDFIPKEVVLIYIGFTTISYS